MIWGKYLVGRRIVGEANITVDTKVDVLEGQLGNRRVRRDDLVGEGCHVRLPVFEGAAVLGVVG